MLNLKKYLLPVIGALALAIGATGTVSAATYGTIPTGSVNNGVFPIYGTNTRDGWFGADLYLVGGPADIKVTFIGNEAGYINEFIWDSGSIFSTNSVTNNTWSVNGVAPTTPITFNNVASGLLDFCFTINSGADSVCNGANPDDSAGGSGVNYFVSFSNPAASSSTTWVDIWLDDAGAGPDDNHDDMAIRLELTNGGDFAVPIPAAVWLFGSGLLGLVGMARRKKAA